MGPTYGQNKDGKGTSFSESLFIFSRIKKSTLGKPTGNSFKVNDSWEMKAY